MVELGLGMMRLPLLDENDFKSIDYEQVNKMVDSYMESGFNFFDTAYVYHEGVGEEAFRKSVVERYPRDSFMLSTKLSLFVITKESQLEPLFVEQLKNCGIRYAFIRTAKLSSCVTNIPPSPAPPRFLVGKKENTPISPMEPAFFPL